MKIDVIGFVIGCPGLNDDSGNRRRAVPIVAPDDITEILSRGYAGIMGGAGGMIQVYRDDYGKIRVLRVFKKRMLESFELTESDAITWVRSRMNRINWNVVPKNQNK